MLPIMGPRVERNRAGRKWLLQGGRGIRKIVGRMLKNLRRRLGDSEGGGLKEVSQKELIWRHKGSSPLIPPDKVLPKRKKEHPLWGGAANVTTGSI